MDLIDRQAAIDVMCELMHHWFGGDSKDEIREIKRELEKLPSAHPSFPQAHENDCISRAEAIDAVRENESENYITINNLIDKDVVVALLEALPSAQPERPEQPESAKKYCAECDHIEMCRWYPYEGCEFRSLPSAQPEQRWIPCGKCIHADGKHRWCKILDRSINEDYFCYWAEPWKEGEANG